MKIDSDIGKYCYRDACIVTRLCVISGNVESTGELGYDGPLRDRFLHMMLGPSSMHIKYSSYMYVYDGFCI